MKIQKLIKKISIWTPIVIISMTISGLIGYMVSCILFDLYKIYGDFFTLVFGASIILVIWLCWSIKQLI